MRIIAILFLCLFSSIVCSAQNNLYRWQDANGQWHFGDAANSNGHAVQAVELPPQAKNVVKMPKIKPLKSKKTNVRTKLSSSKLKKKARCDKKRDELRFKAFRHEERNQYDHECISEMKW
jgi:hypothetical protein